MIDLKETIDFYRNLMNETTVKDSRDFYEQVAYWLEDYKKIKDRAVEETESNLQCPCCGAKSIFDAIISTTDSDSLTVRDTGDGEEPFREEVRQARVCRRCGSVIPYIRATY